MEESSSASFVVPHRSRRFHWYIRQKPSPPDFQGGCKTEPSTSSEDLCGRRKTSVEDDLSEYRLCGGGVSAKYLSNIIVIAVIQEISCGLVFATHTENFFHDPQRIILSVCRIVQFVPCFMALLGNYRNNALLSIPFMLSQAFVGSYADIHTWVLLVCDWRDSFPSSLLFSTPLVFLVIPLVLYTSLLCLILYVQYKAIQFVSIKKLSQHRVAADETVVESLM